VVVLVVAFAVADGFSILVVVVGSCWLLLVVVCGWVLAVVFCTNS